MGLSRLRGSPGRVTRRDLSAGSAPCLGVPDHTVWHSPKPHTPNFYDLVPAGTPVPGRSEKGHWGDETLAVLGGGTEGGEKPHTRQHPEQAIPDFH